MKNIRKFVSINLFLIIYIYALIYSATPKAITMIQGKELSYPFYDFIDINFNEQTNIKAVGSNLVSPVIGREKATLSLFGIVPLIKSWCKCCIR